jgi:hypothetical protein
VEVAVGLVEITPVAQLPDNQVAQVAVVVEVSLLVLVQEEHQLLAKEITAVTQVLPQMLTQVVAVVEQEKQEILTLLLVEAQVVQVVMVFLLTHLGVLLHQRDKTLAAHIGTLVVAEAV